MYCRDQESLNWLAQCTWLMAADQYLIVLAISCIGSFRGEAHIESQASSPCGLPCGVPWTEHPDRSSPSAPVLRRAGVERRQLYLRGRHELADNSFREVGSRRWTVRIISGPPFCTRTFRPSPVSFSVFALDFSTFFQNIVTARRDGHTPRSQALCAF